MDAHQHRLRRGLWALMGQARRRRITRVLATAVVAWTVTPAAGHAAATAQVDDGAGDVGYSFDATTDLLGLRVTWDDSALTVAATYTAPPPSANLDVLVSSAAKSETDPDVERCDPDMAGAITVTVRGSQATLVVENISGSLTAPVQWSGTTATYSFTAPTLVQAWGPGGLDPFACTSGTADGDAFYGAFDGKTIKLTPQTATAAVRAELARRWGTGSGVRVAVRCPQGGIHAATEPSADAPGQAASAFCAFEYRRGRSLLRSGGTSVSLSDGVPQFDRFGATTLPGAYRSCGGLGDHGNPALGYGWGPVPIFGGGIVAWAQRVPCSAARRVAQRWNGKRRYRGYQCRVLKRGYEFVRVRCSRGGGRIVRWEAGA